MTDTHIRKSFGAGLSASLLGPVLIGVAILGAYTPTIRGLINGPWQTEQEGHGPLIIAATLWLVWQSRERLRRVELAPAPIAGWAVLLPGLVFLYLSRLQQGLLTVEVGSILPVIVGSILICAGWPMLRALAFPLSFFVFAVPMPDWLVDAMTVPLKVFISDTVTKVLYAAGFPVAQNGVMIMIGSYQLLVKDACSGMNSIFALSAIGLFYVYAFRWTEKLRSFLLLLAIVPITILANFFRVFALVLMAYYGGPDLIEGVVHDLTGISLFVIALLLLFTLDGLLGMILSLVMKSRRRRAVA